MYEAFYQLHTRPFENTPDPRFFFASEQHREALAAIEYTIRLRKGFVLITGEIGSGKTTVARTICERCGQQATVIQLLHSHEDGRSLVRQTLRAMGVRPRRSDDHARCLERLREHLVQRLQQNRPVVLFIDEAQTLSDHALEELRLLSNFDGATQKPVQVVLIGQPELRQRVASPRFEALRQRIVLAKQLRAMSRQETSDYIAHRLRSASQDPQSVQVSFDAPAVHQIYEFAKGIPRLVNVTCDNCLLLGFVRESRQISAAMVQRVVSDMVPSFSDTSEPAAADEPALALTGTY